MAYTSLYEPEHIRQLIGGLTEESGKRVPYLVQLPWKLYGH